MKVNYKDYYYKYKALKYYLKNNKNVVPTEKNLLREQKISSGSIKKQTQIKRGGSSESGRERVINFIWFLKKKILDLNSSYTLDNDLEQRLSENYEFIDYIEHLKELIEDNYESVKKEVYELKNMLLKLIKEQETQLEMTNMNDIKNLEENIQKIIKDHEEDLIKIRPNWMTDSFQNMLREIMIQKTQSGETDMDIIKNLEENIQAFNLIRPNWMKDGLNRSLNKILELEKEFEKIKKKNLITKTKIYNMSQFIRWKPTLQIYMKKLQELLNDVITNYNNYKEKTEYSLFNLEDYNIDTVTIDILNEINNSNIQKLYNLNENIKEYMIKKEDSYPDKEKVYEYAFIKESRKLYDNLSDEEFLNNYLEKNKESINKNHNEHLVEIKTKIQEDISIIDSFINLFK